MDPFKMRIAQLQAEIADLDQRRAAIESMPVTPPMPAGLGVGNAAERAGRLQGWTGGLGMGKPGKPAPGPLRNSPTMQSEIEAGRTALGEIGRFRREMDEKGRWHEFGPIEQSMKGLGRLVGLASDSSDLQARSERLVQLVGKYMEGGVLREGDITRYRKMLPSIYDSEEVAQRKLDQAEEMMRTEVQNRINTLASQGYDVRGWENAAGEDDDYMYVDPERLGVMNALGGY